MDQKSFWKDAFTAGMIAGLFVSATEVLNWVLKFQANNMYWLTIFIDTVLVVFLMHFFGNKRAATYGKYGFTYAQSLVFVTMMMMFAGILLGVTQYTLANIIDPTYYQTISHAGVQAQMESNPAASEEMYALGMKISDILTGNPVFVVIINVIGNTLMGLFVGLFVSIAIQKPATISVSDYQYTEQ